MYGLSADKPEAQAAWKQAQAYNFPLLCDPEFKVWTGRGGKGCPQLVCVG